MMDNKDTTFAAAPPAEAQQSLLFDSFGGAMTSTVCLVVTLLLQVLSATKERASSLYQQYNSLDLFREYFDLEPKDVVYR